MRRLRNANRAHKRLRCEASNQGIGRGLQRITSISDCHCEESPGDLSRGDLPRGGDEAISLPSGGQSHEPRGEVAFLIAFVTLITSSICAMSWTRRIDTPAIAHRATVAAVPKTLCAGSSLPVILPIKLFRLVPTRTREPLSTNLSIFF